MAKSQTIEVGKSAPKIEFFQCLNGDISKEYFKGKTVILEFWATWCAPCIAGFPHLNNLSKECSTEEVVFVSITKEQDIDKVKRLFEKKPLDAYNLIDDNNKTNKSYGIRAIPKTFVIGSDGTLLWAGNYKKLTRDLLNTIITDQQPVREEKKPTTNILEEKVLSGFQLNVSLSADQTPIDFGKRLSMDPGRDGYYSWTANTWSFINFFGLQLNGINKTRVVCNKSSFNIDINYSCDTNYTNPHSILMNSLANIYNFTYHLDTTPVECWTLKIEDSKKLEAHQNSSTKSSWTRGDESYIFIAQPLTSVCAQLERFQNEIVEIERSSEDKNYDIEFPNTNWKEVQDYLLKEYGLVLVKTRKKVELLTISFK